MGEIAGPALTGPDEVSGERSSKETFSPRWPKQPSGAWPFEHDFDPAVLRPALREQQVARHDPFVSSLHPGDFRLLGGNLCLGLRQLRGLLVIGRLGYARRQNECGERCGDRPRNNPPGHRRPPPRRLYAPGAPGPCTVISIRRFAARPCGVSLEATG